MQQSHQTKEAREKQQYQTGKKYQKKMLIIRTIVLTHDLQASHDRHAESKVILLDFSSAF